MKPPCCINAVKHKPRMQISICINFGKLKLSPRIKDHVELILTQPKIWESIVQGESVVGWAILHWVDRM